jgi:hypothetical protein
MQRHFGRICCEGWSTMVRILIPAFHPTDHRVDYESNQRAFDSREQCSTGPCEAQLVTNPYHHTQHWRSSYLTIACLNMEYEQWQAVNSSLWQVKVLREV